MIFCQVKSLIYICVDINNTADAGLGSQNTDMLEFNLPHHSALIIALSMTLPLMAGSEIGCFLLSPIFGYG